MDSNTEPIGAERPSIGGHKLPSADSGLAVVALDERRRCAAPAFSLLEVVVAVGVFALGIVVVIGLFAPLAQSTGHSVDAVVAVQLNDALRAELSQRVRVTRSFASVTALFNASSQVDSGIDAPLLFANRSGTKIGGAGDAQWRGAGDERFFEIALFRNETLSPESADATALALVYTARIRWPAFVGAESSVDPATFGRRTILIAGAVAR